MNWRIKIIAKILLKRLPLPYKFWRALGLFKLGKMSQEHYAEKIFYLHFKNFPEKSRPENFTLLELGPGDSLLSGLFSYINGCKQTYLIDTGNFSDCSLNLYKHILKKSAKSSLDDLPEFETTTEMCEQLSIIYLTDGLDSLGTIEDNSVDFIFSHSVMEHVRKAEISETLKELYRMQAYGGYSSHNIDYQDHLGGNINNLRFSESLWESEFFAQSGFYTNRINAPDMHENFRKAGFKIIDENFGNWGTRKLDVRKIHKDMFQPAIETKLFPTSSILLKKNP
jgi:hypothetical protein